PSLAMVSLGHRGIGFQVRNQVVVGLCLLPCQIAIKGQERNQGHDGYVVGRGTDLPKLSPIHKCSRSFPLASLKVNMRVMSDCAFTGCGKSRFWARTLPSAAKADYENPPVIAAVNRCATQNQVQH